MIHITTHRCGIIRILSKFTWGGIRGRIGRRWGAAGRAGKNFQSFLFVGILDENYTATSYNKSYVKYKNLYKILHINYLDDFDDFLEGFLGGFMPLGNNFSSQPSGILSRKNFFIAIIIK